MTSKKFLIPILLSLLITVGPVRAVTPPPVPRWPIITGWGGVRLDEATASSVNPPSRVFVGEAASNMEMIIRLLWQRGNNGVRVSFESQCSNPMEMGPYSSSNLNRAIATAQYYGFWVIIDNHAYNDLQSQTSCWLNFWAGVIIQFQGSYNKIIWEPINEPTGIDVSTLSTAYQQWINQARALGDTHWIVVQNLCSFACSLTNWADGFPTINDGGSKVLISLHSYMFYSDYSSSWNNATAESIAQRYYQAVVDGSTRTGWPVLNTEGGGDFGSSTPPDVILSGSAGYSTTSSHFIETLTHLYDSHSPRIGWLWWPSGSWTNTPGAGLYGANAANGWGTLLQFQPLSLCIRSDANGSLSVDIDDLIYVWQSQFRDKPPADIDRDGLIDVTDLITIWQNQFCN